MRNREAEKAMLREVHLRNLIAKYRDLNEREYGVAVTPEVGIFWMDRDGKKFLKIAVSIRDAADHGDFRGYEGSHYEDWEKAVREYPQWEGMEYEQVPRGRVVLCVSPGKSRFVVYVPKALKQYESRIARSFLLPSGDVRFDYSDEHYGPSSPGVHPC